jgi:hypothetical protein
LTNLLISVLPKAGSGNVSRFGTSLRLGILKISQSPADIHYSIRVRMPVESQFYCRLLANADWRFSAGVSP